MNPSDIRPSISTNRWLRRVAWMVAAILLTLDIDDVVWPMERAASFKGSFGVASAATGAAEATPQGGTAPKAAGVVFEGSGTDRQATLALKLSDAPLELAAPYVAQYLKPELRGQLNSDLGLRWDDAGLQLTVASLTLDQLALVDAQGARQAAMPRIRRLALSAANLDLQQRRLKVGKLEIMQPELAVSRGADKRWMFEPWLKTPANGTPSSAQPGSAGSPAPWLGQLDHLQLRDAAVRFDDSAQPKPVRLRYPR